MYLVASTHPVITTETSIPIPDANSYKPPCSSLSASAYIQTSAFHAVSLTLITQSVNPSPISVSRKMTKYKVGMLIVLVARVSLSNLRLRDRGEYHPIFGATDSASHSTGEILLKLPAKAKLVQFACLCYCSLTTWSGTSLCHPKQQY